MKLNLAVFLLLFINVAYGQTEKIDVLTLGTFHFSFPNLDVQQTDKNDQIDVLQAKYQNEIEELVKRLEKFKPTVIAIERQPNEQPRVDSLFAQYLQGKYALKRDEGQQIGFRLAKLLGLKRLYCVDEWGNFNEHIDRIINNKDTAEAKRFEDYFEKDPDRAKKFSLKPIIKTHGILAALKQANDEKNIKQDLGNYLIGLFKYESQENDFAGVDFETGRWFNRNLKIFRNIQRINAKTSDRILVIYGAGHLNILNYLFECSPEYNLVKAVDYLK